MKVFSLLMVGLMSTTSIQALADDHHVNHHGVAHLYTSVDISNCELLMTNPEDIREKMVSVVDHVSTKVVGLRDVIEKTLVTMIVGGHLLLEGPPGLSKTRLVNSLTKDTSGTTSRIQFVPDLMPSDIYGSRTYDPQTRAYSFVPGPIFRNIVLADEVNRATSKGQSALLEAMGEGQVTVAGHVYRLPEVFTVIATQNPLDGEGTFPLPQAQLDRFLMRILIRLPELNTEREILRMVRQESANRVFGAKTDGFKPVNLEYLLAARKLVLAMPISEKVEDYILNLVMATRHPGQFSPTLEGAIDEGVGPRGTTALANAASGIAWLHGHQEVTLEDVDAVLPNVFGHRLRLKTTFKKFQTQTAEEITETLRKAVRANMGI